MTLRGRGGAETVGHRRELISDGLRANEIAPIGVVQKKLAQDVEVRGEVPPSSAEGFRPLQVREQRLRGIAGGLGQHHRVQPPKPQLVTRSLRRVRKMLEETQARLETGDDVPVGAPIIGSGSRLLQIDESTRLVAAAFEMPGEIARQLGGPSGE